MKINPDNSKMVRFTRARVNGRLTYYFGDQLIPKASSFKYLGVINHTWRSKLGRSCKLHATKSMEIHLTMRVLEQRNNSSNRLA
jgi:hypothetical protein